MKQAASLKDFAPDTLVPGIHHHQRHRLRPIEQLKMMQFKGGKWELFGDIISAETGVSARRHSGRCKASNPESRVA